MTLTLAGTSASRCSVRVGVTDDAGQYRITNLNPGTYSLNSRNRVTGSSRTCTHRLAVTGYDNSGTDQGDCEISGPSTIDVGTSATLCAPSYANTTYRWTGPNGFVSTSRCVNADDAGTYYLTMRNTSTG